jgi:hypothetical protein
MQSNCQMVCGDPTSWFIPIVESRGHYPAEVNIGFCGDDKGDGRIQIK